MSFKIVAAVDLSEYAETVLEHAFDEANRHDATELHVLSVLEASRDPEAAATLRNQLGKLVLRTLEPFGKRGSTWTLRLHVRTGRPAEEIANLAAEVESDLVIVGRFGTHRRGSVADDVLRRAIGPVLIVQLKDFEVDDRVEQCPSCVAVRRTTGGDRWFCDDHRRDHSLNGSLLLPHEHWGLGDGLKW